MEDIKLMEKRNSSIQELQDEIQQLQDENTGLRSRNEELLIFQEKYVNELEVMKGEREQLKLLFPHFLSFGKPIRHLSLLDEKPQLHAARFKSRSTGAQRDQGVFKFPVQVSEDDEVDESDYNLQTSYSVPIQWEVDGLAVLKSRIRELEQEVDELKQENNALGQEQRKLGTLFGLQPGKPRQTSLESKITGLQHDLCKMNQLTEELSSKMEIIRQLKGQIKNLELDKEAVEEERNQEMKKSASLELEVAKVRTRLQDLERRTTENTTRLYKALYGDETDVKGVDALDSSVTELLRHFSRLGEQESSLQEELQRKQRIVDELTQAVSTLEGDRRQLNELYELEKNKYVHLQRQYLRLEQEEMSKLKQEKDELIEQYRTKSDSYDQELASLDLKLRQLNKLQDSELTKLYRTLRSEQEGRDEKVTWELLNKALNELELEQESLQVSLATKSAQQEEVEQKNCRLESYLKQEKDKVADLQLKMLKIEAELESSRNSQEFLEAELATKSFQLEELEQERSRLASCLEQEKDKVGDLQLKMLKIEGELDNLQAEFTSKAARLEQLEQERNRLETCLKQEKDKVGDLELKVLKISDELKLEQIKRFEELEDKQLNEVNRSKTEMRNKVKELESKINVLEQNNQTMTEHVEAVVIQNKTFMVVLKFFRAQVFGLVQKMRSLDNEVDETRALLQKRGDEVTRLMEKLDKAQEEMAEEKSRLLTEVNLRAEEKREAIRQLCFSISCMRDANEELKEKLKNFRIKVRVRQR